MTITTEQRRSAPPAAPKLHPAVLGRYRDEEHEERELRCLHLCDGRRLVVDWRRAQRADARLVGELAADEPPENAAILASVYLEDPKKGICAALRACDLSGDSPSSASRAHLAQVPLREKQGLTYQLRTVHDGEHCPELRWTCTTDGGDQQPLSLRDVIGRLQAYEPVVSLTRRALEPRVHEDGISLRCLRAELQRMDASPLLLNRRLREFVLTRVECGLSLSEIAARCGRAKITNGCVSGDTSWLTRRIGLNSEHGREAPTPWVHADVLALIARDGLGICPLEVEAA